MHRQPALLFSPRSNSQRLHSLGSFGFMCDGCSQIPSTLTDAHFFSGCEACVVIGHTCGKSKEERIERFQKQGLGPNYLIAEETPQITVCFSPTT